MKYMLNIHQSIYNAVVGSLTLCLPSATFNKIFHSILYYPMNTFTPTQMEGLLENFMKLLNDLQPDPHLVHETLTQFEQFHQYQFSNSQLDGLKTDHLTLVDDAIALLKHDRIFDDETKWNLIIGLNTFYDAWISLEKQ